MGRHEVFPNVIRPSERDAVDNGGRCGRIVGAAKRLGDPIDVAGIDEADEDLLPLGRDLYDFQAPVQQHEEGLGSLSLLEHRGPFRDALRLGVGDNVIELGLAHSAEDR
jgi:hypothetical protein